MMMSVILFGCKQEDAAENNFTVFIFSSLPESSREKMKVFTENEVDQFDIELYPPVFERLVAEVASHHGDVFILDRDLLPSIYDSEGLLPLETFRDESNTVKLDEAEQEALLADGHTGKVDIYENALKVTNGAALFYDESNFSEEHELVAVIPVYTKHEQKAYNLIENLVQN